MAGKIAAATVPDAVIEIAQTALKGKPHPGVIEGNVKGPT
jgi:hypothetical protein